MEIWKDIEGYELFYQVSNLGRVKSLDRIVINKNGFNSRKKGFILKPQNEVNGYVHVCLCKESVKDQRMIHRIVMETFNGYQHTDVNHKDLNKKNNRLDNLEYCTRRENMIHCFNYRETTSNYNGISLVKIKEGSPKQWEVRIGHLNSNFFLGRYKTEEKAISIHQEYMPKIIGSKTIAEAKEWQQDLIAIRKWERLFS